MLRDDLKFETASPNYGLLLTVIFPNSEISPICCQFNFSNDLNARRDSSKIEQTIRGLRNRWVIHTLNSFADIKETHMVEGITLNAQSNWLCNSVCFESYFKISRKQSSKKRNVSSMRRRPSYAFGSLQESQSENFHPNIITNTNINQSHDLCRNKPLRVSNSYCRDQNSTIQQPRDSSWYNVQRPMSTIGLNQIHKPCLSGAKRNQCETGSTIGSGNNIGNMHTTVNSICDDERNFYYKPANHIAVGMQHYQPKFKDAQNMPYKRYSNSLSTIVKEDTIQNDEIISIHNLDIR